MDYQKNIILSKLDLTPRGEKQYQLNPQKLEFTDFKLSMKEVSYANVVMFIDMDFIFTIKNRYGSNGRYIKVHKEEPGSNIPSKFKFKKGDRVKLVGGEKLLINKTGTILQNDNYYPFIKLDKKILGGHTCYGLCELGYGCCCGQYFLEHLEGDEIKSSKRIILNVE